MMKRSSLASFAALAVVGVVAMGASTARANPTQVTGSVADQATGKPVPSALVVVSGDNQYRTTTDAAGRFTVQVAPGFYAVLASAPGRVGSTPDIRVVAGTTAFVVVPIRVAPAQQ
jgi:hypothetical protein